MVLMQGDCLERMNEIDSSSIDMILCDLPYGTTDCKWDEIIPFEPMWEQFQRVTKKGANIVLFSSQPFTTKLISSNFKNFKYTWYRKKNNVTGGAFAKVQPMRCIEDICVFRYDLAKDNKGYFLKCREYMQSEKTKSGRTTKEFGQILSSRMTSHYFTNGEQFEIPTPEAYKKLQSTGFFKMPYGELKELYHQEKQEALQGESFVYNPQGLTKLENKRTRSKPSGSGVYSEFRGKNLVQEFTGYPSHLLEIDNIATNAKDRYHPTEKPVELLEYLIKTYTNEGMTVLDCCMGSGSTGVACKKTNRDFIGIELDQNYFGIAKKRIEETKAG